MNSRDQDRVIVNDRDRPRSIAGLNLWVIIPTVIIAVGMAIYGLNLRNDLLVHQAESDKLAESIQTLSRLTGEKKNLMHKAAMLDIEKDKRLDTARKAFSFVDKVGDFPIDEGDLLVFDYKNRIDGQDVFFYAPAGKHELTLKVGKEIRGMGAGSFHNNESKVFLLPQKSRGCLQFRFKNVEDKCHVTAKLFDGNDNELSQAEFEFPKKTLTGEDSGYGSRNFFYRPGDVGMGVGNFRTWCWHLCKAEQAINVLKIQVSLNSQSTQNFVSLPNIRYHLLRENFGALFEPTVKDGKVILTKQGSAMIEGSLHY